MSGNVVDNYGWDTGEGPESCGYVAPAILKLLTGYGAKRVVDVGAGNGALCAFLKAGAPECYVAGIEYDAEGVAMACREHATIRFHKQGVQDDPATVMAIEGDPFDAVVSTEVIEHLFSPHLLPRYAAGLLRESGLLIVTTPYHGYLKNLAMSLVDGWDKHHTPLWHGGHIKFWSRATLSRLLAENGFDVIQFSGVGRLPYLWKSMVLVARKRNA